MNGPLLQLSSDIYDSHTGFSIQKSSVILIQWSIMFHTYQCNCRSLFRFRWSQWRIHGWVKGHKRVRQIVCPVIPGTPKSLVGPLDIFPRCSVGTLHLALITCANITAIATIPQTRDHVMFKQVQWAFKASRVASDGAAKP